MTSELKCPVCGKDLIPMTLSSNDNGTLYSSVAFPTKDCICNTSASKKIWQALIQAKQDLEIATKALEEIDTSRCIPQQTLISLGKRSKTTRFNAGNIICVATPDYIHNTLEQIKHKE